MTVLRRVLVAAAVLLAAPAVPAGVAPTAAGQGELEDGPTVSLASKTPWVSPGGELVLRLRVDGVAAEDDVDVAVTLHTAVTSRSAFDLGLEGRSLGSTVALVGPTPLSELDPDAAGARIVRIPVQDPAQPRDRDRVALRRSGGRQDGVYPVRVELRERDGGHALDGFTTHLVLLPAELEDYPTLAVAWVQPLRARPAVQPDGTVEVDEDDADRLATIAAALAAHPDVGMTLAPTPETLESLSQARERAAIVEDVTAAVRATGRQLVSGTYVDVDLTTLVAEDLDGELLLQMQRGAAVLDQQLDMRADFRTWLADTTLDAAASERLCELGVDQLVVPEQGLEPPGLPLTLARPLPLPESCGRRQLAAVADAGLTEHFRPADEEEPTADDVLRAHHLLADLAVLHFDSPGVDRGVVVQPPGGWAPSPAFLDTVLSAIDSGPLLDPVTVDELFRRVPLAVDVEGEPLVGRLVPERRPALGVAPDAIRSLRDDLTGYGSMVTPDTPTLDALERRLLVAEAAGLSAADRRAYLIGTSATLEGELSKIQAPDRTSIRLTAREGTIPLSLRNEADYPVTVEVRLDSDKLSFPEGNCPGPDPDGCEVRRLDLEGSVTLEVLVQAPTPGAFPLQVTLSSPDHRLQVRQARLTVRSTAASWVGVALTMGAVAFLLLWWGRNFHRVRRSRALVDA